MHEERFECSCYSHNNWLQFSLWAVPRMITSRTTPRFKKVKMLVKTDDDFTPTDKITEPRTSN